MKRLLPLLPGATPLSALALAAVLLAGPAAPAARAQATQVNIATDTTDPNNMDDSEPSIAVNPQNPLEITVVSFAEGWSATQAGPVWRSTDGGATWTKLFLLPRPVAGSTGSGDQKIAYTAAGQLLVAELAGAPSPGMTPPRCFIYRQTGSATDLLTVGAAYGDDQPHLDADPLGRAYSPWLDFSPSRERSTVAVSGDLGANVANVGVGDNSSFPNRTTRSAVSSDGRAYIIYKTREGSLGGGFETAHFRVARSDDGGANWNALGAGGVSVTGATAVQTWFTDAFGNPAKGPVARARSSDAWIAVDPGTGEVYAAYCDRDASGFGQVFVARSADLGVTWASTRITDGTHHAAYPEVAVAANGAIGVLYVDYDDTGTRTQFRHHLAISYDDGATWSDQTLQSMDATAAASYHGTDGFLWGDYEGLTALGNRFYGVYTGLATGRTQVQFDPIFFTQSSLPPADVQLTKSASAGTVVTGSNITYTLVVSNSGPAAAANVVVSDSLPSGTTYVSTASTGGGVAAGTGNSRTVTFASLASGATATITLVAQVDCTVADGTAITNTATVTADNPDPVPANNTGSVGITAANPAPVITCPANVAAPNDPGQCSAVLNIGTPGVTDNCPGVAVVPVRSDGLALTAPYPVGTTTVTWTATDSAGATDTCQQTVVVSDVEPPSLGAAAASPSVLWPPDHQMVTIAVTYSVTDNCDPNPTTWLTVTSNEPDNGLGDGDTPGDIVVVDAHTVRLRSERSGGGTGRIYTITVHAQDLYGNLAATRTVTVTVPRSQK